MGNKRDLRRDPSTAHHSKSVQYTTFEDGKEMSKTIQAKAYHETSVKTAENIQQTLKLIFETSQQ
jgi:hypothetical protein